MDKKILLYGFKDDDRLAEIKKSASNLGIDIKELDESDLEKPIGELMDLGSFDPSQVYEGQEVDTEFILFSDFDRAVLQKFVLDLRDKKINVPHKSVLTEHNKTWQLGYLVDHIMEEHQVMQVFSKLKALMGPAKEKYLASKDQKIKDAMDYVMTLNELNDVKYEDVMDRYKKLKEAIDE